jgi:uncharacterized protein
MPALLDTGILYALADRDDAWHERCVEYLSSIREPLVAPVTVVPEAAYLIRDRLGEAAEHRLIRSIVNAELHVEDLLDTDWARIAELMKKYPEIGFVDASVVAVAERLRLSAIVTTDRRHFAQVRPRHRAAFDLLPRR